MIKECAAYVRADYRTINDTVIQRIENMRKKFPGNPGLIITFRGKLTPHRKKALAEISKNWGAVVVIVYVEEFKKLTPDERGDDDGRIQFTDFSLMGHAKNVLFQNLRFRNDGEEDEVPLGWAA